LQVTLVRNLDVSKGSSQVETIKIELTGQGSPIGGFPVSANVALEIEAPGL
jgi:hypothetical protein